MTERRMTMMVLALVAAVAMLFTACASETEPAQSRSEPEQSETERDATEQLGYEEIIELTIADLHTYWAEELPEVYGIAYEEPGADSIIAATPDNPPPACGEDIQGYDDIAGNAIYCSGTDGYVAWDDVELFPRLYGSFGPFTVAFVLAHEWGHLVQSSAGVEAEPVVTELQADCFAGSWAGWLADGGGQLELSDASLEQAILGLLEFRDEPGSEADGEDAHGSGFDRVNAFQDGYEGGATNCAAYPEEPPEIFQIPFDSEESEETGGNLPFEEILEVSIGELNAYWIELDEDFDEIVVVESVDGEFPGDCTGGVVRYCPSDNSVLYDDAGARKVRDDIGDFGVATLFSMQWATASQVQSDTDTESAEASLQQACLTGAWVSRFEDLDPGDLDEAIQAFVGSGSVEGAGVFELVSSFRSGFFEYSESC